jgi:hypothetical protein
MSRQHHVDVEVVHVHLDEVSELLHWRLTSEVLEQGADPDAVALAQLRGADVSILHSTSWRRETDGVLVLTYACLHPTPPANDPVDRSVPFQVRLVVTSGDPRRPSPSQVHAHYVVAHAIQHLSDLVERDPAVQISLADERTSNCWSAVRQAALTLRTDVHQVTHSLD